MEKKQKYSWFLTNEKELPYTVIHTEEDGVETIIAHADTSEKADFISKACNQFNYNQYESEQPPFTFEKELEHLDKEANKLMDRMIEEMNNAPLIAQQSGCDFRWKIIQIVSSTKKYYSVEDIIIDSQKLIDWINEETITFKVNKHETERNKP